jgi:hypothetical protein
MIKAVGIGLFVSIVGVVLGIRSGTLHADDKLDCSSASKFSDSHEYKKGDTVWWSSGGGAANEYRCKSGTCKDLTPTVASWEKVGECRSGTAK